MAQYTLIESFDVDDDSLDGLSRGHCFTLGVEWMRFRTRIMAGEQFTKLCHAANERRLVALAERHGRFVESHPCSEGWASIFVGGSTR